MFCYQSTATTKGQIAPKYIIPATKKILDQVETEGDVPTSAYELLVGLLKVDPMERWTSEDALASKFLEE